MKKIIVTAVTVIAVAITQPIWSADDQISGDEDSLFNIGTSADTELVVDIDEEQQPSLENDALETEGTRIGGSFKMKTANSWLFSKDAGSESWEVPGLDAGRLVLDLKAELFFEARPDSDTKFFGSIKIDGPLAVVEDDAATLLIDESRGFDDILKINELFADFNYRQDIFFRAGKQTIGYGVGYFFSPVDVLSIGKIDLEDPEAEREGPIALKTSIPLGLNSLQLFIAADESISSVSELSFMPTFDFLRGNAEIGVGLYYRSDRAPKALLSLSTSIFSDVRLFGEAAIGYGTPAGLSFSEEDEIFGQLSGGINYSKDLDTDDGFRLWHSSLIVQYLFNFGDPERKELIKMPGDHYLTYTKRFSDIAGSGISLSNTGAFNLSDGSKQMLSKLTFDIMDGLEISTGVSWLTAADGAEKLTATISANFGSGSF